jgi:phosphatidylinositol-bisphosphatase
MIFAAVTLSLTFYQAGSSTDVDMKQSQIHFNWLVPYYSRFVHQYLCESFNLGKYPAFIDLAIPVVSSTPTDLRVVNKGLHDRLSPASAGFSGNDNADIRLIRDEWVREKARSLSRQERRKLSLRLGTFNVNGKLPSQDLSSWVQGIPASTSKAHEKGVSPSSNEAGTVSSHQVSNNLPDGMLHEPSFMTH